MHMADALISPAVGGMMWAVSAGLAAHCTRRLKTSLDERLVPLMGVMGAFVFSAQMLNFTIPSTGSSGHLGGGLLLALLLGPHAAFLVMFSILAVQALFFADGGLLALGCNVFNLGFWSCFVAYPLIFRPLTQKRPSREVLAAAAIMGGVVALQLGALGVVLETCASGISELPFKTFILLMQPIHLAIGIVEGLATAAVATYVWGARPELLELAALGRPADPAGLRPNFRPVLITFAALAVMAGGVFSWFASIHPDGLEWSMFKTSGREELAAPAGPVHATLAGVQERTAFLPDYSFPAGAEKSAPASSEIKGLTSAAAVPAGEPAGADAAWPAISAGTSLSGLVGGALTLLIAGLIGLALRRLQPAA